MNEDNFIKLTKIQQEVLELLEDGNILVIDRMNMASIEKRNVASNTRYFLTDNKLVTSKDKSKSIHTKGNGFIISEKGHNVLISNKNIIRRGTPKILLEEKKCAKCDIVKPITSFVSIYGFKNPRGKYCDNCFSVIQQEHAITLMEGRDSCLYCGKKIAKVYDWTINGKSTKTYLHRDHMDPLSLGGEDSEDNTVYCCVNCNTKKGNKTFVAWLKNLEPKYAALAREVYIEKHKCIPEHFKPSPTELVITFSVQQI